MIKNIPDFLIDMLNEQYGQELTSRIINGLEQKRYVTIRVNTLKSNVDLVKEVLNQNGILFEDVSFYKDALIIKNACEKDIEKLDIYKNGEIYLQSLSSMLPPIILNPKPNMDILDMCAAPGGKTTQLAAISENEAHITACEMNHIRLERLKYNIEKQGASCVYTMQNDSRFIDDFFSFDSILLDAPCSGSGTIDANDEKMPKIFTKQLIQKSIKSQTTLLKKALKILKRNSQMVYSTCSILSCENEEILNKILKETNARIVPIEFEGMDKLPLLPTTIDGTICVCPNELYEGFFVAKILLP